MKLPKVKYSPEFLKSLKKLPRSQLKNLTVKEKIFKENTFDSRLKTHKLKGPLIGFYSFSISHHWRIVFHFEGDDIYFDAVGTHSIYK